MTPRYNTSSGCMFSDRFISEARYRISPGLLYGIDLFDTVIPTPVRNNLRDVEPVNLIMSNECLRVAACKMRVRHHHHRRVLDDGSSANGGHCPHTHRTHAVAGSRLVQGHVSSVHEGQCSHVNNHAHRSTKPISVENALSDKFVVVASLILCVTI